MAGVPGALSREELCRLIEGTIGERRMAEIKAALGDFPAAPFDAPEKILCILFASRAGSSYAGRLLANTPWFGQVGENFAPDQLFAIAARRGLPDLHAAAQWMIRRRGSDRAFGYKAGFSVLASAAQLGFLGDTLERTRFVMLRRRDRIAQAVSLAKAEMSGRFHSNQDGAEALTAEDYDGEAILHCLHRIERAEHELADFAERVKGVAAPVVYYEDICADPAGFVGATLEMLDLPMPGDFDASVDLEILRDEVSEAWAARFRKERPVSN
jgi:LPS sulfotransferase NodH